MGQSHPPGRVIELRGIIFQSDNYSFSGAWLIRPVQTLDRWLAGLRQSTFGPPLAMHVGLHVIIEGGREFVVEQLFGTPWHAFVDGVNWTPLEVFRARDRGGWDLTVPATAFRKIDDRIVREAIDFLNSIQSRPYFSEDCPTFVERAFWQATPVLRIVPLPDGSGSASEWAIWRCRFSDPRFGWIAEPSGLLFGLLRQTTRSRDAESS
jgi:hypothetical protein